MTTEITTTTASNQAYPALQRFIHDLEQNPYRYNPYSLLQQLKAIKLAFKQENQPFPLKIRLGQEASLRFATSSIQSIEISNNVLRINVNGYGLLGVNAPMPLHFTEYVFERNHQYGDKTWLAFINLLQHRLIEQFHQSWENAQSIASLHHPDSHHFSRYIASFVGLAWVDLATPYEHIHPYAKLYYAGLYAGERRSASNLQAMLSQYFNVPLKIQQNTGFWQAIEPDDATQLGANLKFSLGQGLICGDKLYDLQNKLTVVIGSLDLDTYLKFFKHQPLYQQLQEWLALYLGHAYLWDCQLILKQQAVPLLVLGDNVQLGLTSWLGKVNHDVADAIISGQ